MRSRKKGDRIGGDTSDVVARVIGMVLVAIMAVAAVVFLMKAGYFASAVVVKILAFIALVILFAGSDRLARPLMFVLRPMIWLIRTIVQALTNF